MESLERYRGCLLGLAVGDAVGTTLEFSSPGTFKPISDMVGGGPFGLDAGQWTDDTSMALCLAESLIESKGFDARDQLERYCRWWKEGHLSSRGQCFDIGSTTRNALLDFMKNGTLRRPENRDEAGDGSIMRLAPIPMFFAADPFEAMRQARENSLTTHGAREAVDACAYLAGLIAGALRGVDKETLLSDSYSPAPGFFEQYPPELKIKRVMQGSFKRKKRREIRGGFYVVESLEAALWAFQNNDNYRDGCLAAVNLGDDADTTGAVFGQLAGAYWGENAIPQSWREKLVLRDQITSYAEGLFKLSGI